MQLQLLLSDLGNLLLVLGQVGVLLGLYVDILQAFVCLLDADLLQAYLIRQDLLFLGLVPFELVFEVVDL